MRLEDLIAQREEQQAKLAESKKQQSPLEEDPITSTLNQFSRRNLSPTPTLKAFSSNELEEILLQHQEYEERKKQIGRISNPDYLVTQVNPVDPEILDYLQKCPQHEWDDFFEEIADINIVEAARSDPNVFVEYCFTDKDGVPWKQESFHRDWHALLPTAKDAKIIASGKKVRVKLSDETIELKSLTTLFGAPREHAKSTQLSIGRIVWEIGNNPRIRVKIVTANDKLAKDIVFDIAQNIEKNPRVRKVFPHLKPDRNAGWSKQTIFVQRHYSSGKDPTVEAMGVLGTGAGSRADILVFDDVIDFRNAVSQPALRIQVEKAIEDVWIPLMPKDGRCWYVATPWHTADYTHKIKKAKGWTVWWKPAYIDVTLKNGNEIRQSLWPSKWDNTALELRKQQIGIRAFTRQFLLKALSNEEATFPETLLASSYDIEHKTFLGKVPQGWQSFAGVDLASSMSKKAAFTVCFTIAVEPFTNRRFPVEMLRGKFKLPEFKKLFVEQWLKHKWNMVYVENNGYQQALIDVLDDEFKIIPVFGFRTGSGKADEDIGLPGLATSFSNKAWAIPQGGEPHEAECGCEICVWLSELRVHPLGTTSDTVMATWFAHRAAIQGGSDFEDTYSILKTSIIEESQKRALVSTEQAYEIRKNKERFQRIEIDADIEEKLLFGELSSI